MMIRRVQVDLDDLARDTGRPSSTVSQAIAAARRAALPVSRRITVKEDGHARTFEVTRHGVGPLVTKLGRFWHMVFALDDQWVVYDVLVAADLEQDTLCPILDPSRETFVRIDSGCTTGQRFGDETCDCSAQLRRAMSRLVEYGQGVIVHVPEQDGRGKGTAFKLGTLLLQDRLGVNTVVAASVLADDGVIDTRSYGGAVAVLDFLGVPRQARLALATGNPEKLAVLGENGFKQAHRVGASVPATPQTEHHLRAKKELLAHAFEL
jgi:GTP cyclohydrolase II